MDNLNEIIGLAKQEILNNSNGHLPLKIRVVLMSTIKDKNRVNNFFLNCAKKVYPIWPKYYPKDDSVIIILRKAEDFLERNKESDFKKDADKIKNYFDSITQKDASYVAHSALSLCNSITYDAAGIINIDEYQNEDDDSFDWETWNTDFWASMAYSGGNPFLQEGSKTLRKEYWFWYLDMLEYFSDNAVIKEIKLETQEEKQIHHENNFKRTPPYTDIEINNKFQKIIDYTLDDLKKSGDESGWKEIVINAICMSAGTSIKANVKTIGQPEIHPIKLTYYLKSGEQSSVNLLNQVKNKMYMHKPEEGAWVGVIIKLQPDMKFSLSYNYDDINLIPIEKQSPAYLEMEFKDFPRTKNFTPQWWQKIVERKVPYLIS